MKVMEHETNGLKLNLDAPTGEVVVAREDIETVLASLYRVLNNDESSGQIVQSVLENIGSQIHWYTKATVMHLQSKKTYRELADMRRTGEEGVSFNPKQGPAHRQTNLEFVNSALDLPEIAGVYGQIRAERDKDEELTEDQLDTIAFQALVRRFTPPDCRPAAAAS